MASDKLKKLIKYSNELKAKLQEPTPEKHALHPATYKRFLENELRMVALSIEKGRLK